MNEWAQGGRNILSKKEDLPQQEREQMEHLVALAEVYGKLVRTPAVDSTLPTPELTAQTPESLLKRVAQEYKADPKSNEALTRLNRTFYEIMGQRIDLEIAVPDCDWTAKEIDKMMPTVEGKAVKSQVLYFPSELRGRDGLVRLGRMFGLTNWSVREDTTIASEDELPSDWIRIEGTIDAPNRNTWESDLKQHAKKHNLFGQNLNVYILGSRFAKLLEDGYFDQGPTYSRLPGSRYGGRLVDAHCYSHGGLHVCSDLNPDDRNSDIGARFAGVKSS